MELLVKAAGFRTNNGGSYMDKRNQRRKRLDVWKRQEEEEEAKKGQRGRHLSVDGDARWDSLMSQQSLTDKFNERTGGRQTM